MLPGGKGIKMAITKCRQTTDNILKMAEAAFPNKGIPQIEELFILMIQQKHCVKESISSWNA